MINNYDSMYIDDGISKVLQTDRVNMFIPFTGINDDGTINDFVTGNVINQQLGFTFIVDSWVPEQYEKLKIDNSGFRPKLTVIDEEKIEDPRTEEQIRIQTLEQELIELRAQQPSMTP